MTGPRGSRFANVQVKDRATGAWAPIDPARSYVLVINDFIAEGRDGYTTLGKVSSSGRSVNTYRLYTQTFVDCPSRAILRRAALLRPDSRGRRRERAGVQPVRKRAASVRPAMGSRMKRLL